MPQLIIDRFEGDWAVLETEDRITFSLPCSLLPVGTREGDVLTLNLERDDGATQERRERAQSLLNDLKNSDLGGDISL